MAEVRLRPAWLHDGKVLTAIALRSKAHWGYDTDFMAACQDELTITEEDIRRDTYVVADHGPYTDALGLYALSGEGHTLEVQNFFIDPPHIGTGLGRRMMDHCKNLARAHSASALVLDADPNAEAFYAHMGFEAVGRSPSASIPGRELPHMRCALG